MRKMMLLFLGFIILLACSKDAPVPEEPVIINYTISISATEGGDISASQGSSLSASGGSFVENTNVSVTATPAEGYEFVEWTGDASGTTNPLTVVMTENKDISANFVRSKYTLSFGVVGSGSVSEEVISTAKNTEEYSSGTVVRLNATPESGWLFNSWSGSSILTANQIDITIDGTKSVTATFEEKIIQVLSSEGGFVGLGRWVFRTPVASGSTKAIVCEISEIIFRADGLFTIVTGNTNITGQFNVDSNTTISLTQDNTPFGNITSLVLTNGFISFSIELNGGCTEDVDGDRDDDYDEDLDTTLPPVISLIGETTIYIDLGDAFSDPGATAEDNIDGDITASITTSGTVDSSTLGTYIIAYSVSDAAGNSSSIDRTVIVGNPAKTYVPDNVFEQNLIDQGYDDVLDDYVLTRNIEDLTTFVVEGKYISGNIRIISDATGIEDFISLQNLRFSNGNMESLDVSNLSNLTSLSLIQWNQNFYVKVNQSQFDNIPSGWENNAYQETVYCTECDNIQYEPDWFAVPDKNFEFLFQRAEYDGPLNRNPGDIYDGKVYIKNSPENFPFIQNYIKPKEVKSIYINYFSRRGDTEIIDFTGIEKFTNLESLKINRDGPAYKFNTPNYNFSKNSKLKRIIIGRQYSVCNDNSGLGNNYFRPFSYSDPNPTVCTETNAVSMNTDASVRDMLGSEWEAYTNNYNGLPYVNTSIYPASNLDLSKNTELEEVVINGLNISSINISNSRKLTKLLLAFNAFESLSINELDNPGLEELAIISNPLLNLNLRGSFGLTLNRTQLQFLDLSQTSMEVLNNVYNPNLSLIKRNPNICQFKVYGKVEAYNSNGQGAYPLLELNSSFYWECTPNGSPQSESKRLQSYKLNDNQNLIVLTDTDNKTYLPDDIFEQSLIDMGYDNVLDNYVFNEAVEKITSYSIGDDVNYSYGAGTNALGADAYKIKDLTGIEAFKSLYWDLSIMNQALETIDVSSLTKLERLNLNGNLLTSLDISKNINLYGNQTKAQNNGVRNQDNSFTNSLNCVKVDENWYDINQSSLSSSFNGATITFEDCPSN